MPLDAVAMEPQFIQHIAPIWLALPESTRGRFLTLPALVDYARVRGVDAEALDRPPFNPAYPKPRHDGPPCLVASYGDIKGARRLGYGPFVFVEHGAGQSYAGARGSQSKNGSYAGGHDREDVHLFLVPNETCAGRWREAYPSARVAVVGCAKLDTLPLRQLISPTESGPVVAISYHWPAGVISQEAGNALGTFGPVMGSLAKRYSVIGHAHPKGDWPDRMHRLYRRWGIEFVPDFEDVCRRADLYVCDNSSTLFEFAATGRPVVVLNDRHYRKNVNHGLRFWDAADVGIQVDDPEKLGWSIDEALRDDPERKAAREAALDIVYQPRRNGAAHAVTAITDWLASREAVAA